MGQLAFLGQPPKLLARSASENLLRNLQADFEVRLAEHGREWCLYASCKTVIRWCPHLTWLHPTNNEAPDSE
jgi:hypothetical protein